MQYRVIGLSKSDQVEIAMNNLSEAEPREGWQLHSFVSVAGHVPPLFVAVMVHA